MAKDELMMAAFAFSGEDHEVKKGLQLPSDHDLVKRFPRYFVPVSAGQDAALQRAHEIERAMEAIREKHKAEARAASVAAGTRILPSDDATAEASKRVAAADSRLELVYSDNGIVTGVRPKR
jgi:hypothetical protein